MEKNENQNPNENSVKGPVPVTVTNAEAIKTVVNHVGYPLSLREEVFLRVLHAVLTGKANREPEAAIADTRMITSLVLKEFNS